MIKIFETNQIKEIDQDTIKYEPISSIDLVERAATLMTQEFVRRYPKNRRVVVFAGHGNNGADALAMARMLAYDKYRVEVVLFYSKDKDLSPECNANRLRLSEVGNIQCTEVISDFLPPNIGPNDIVIDGMFGSGLNRPLRGGFAVVANYINRSGATIVSIDIPSGLFGEDNSGNNPDAIIQSDLTLTLGVPKLSLLLPENSHYVKEWKLLDIGYHPDAIARLLTPYQMVTEEDMAQTYKHRDRFAHKGDFGHALLIAGSRGKMGAAVLAARACLRSGAGLLTVHIPESGVQVMQTALPEAMVSQDKNADYFSSTPMAGHWTVGIGPGIGQQSDTVNAFTDLLSTVKAPIVLDADALNILANNPELLVKVPENSILTPHPKEFDRLVGKSETTYDRLHKAQSFAREHKLYVVLKGGYTATCTPEGEVIFNNCGNPGMATAGSGDVLTGVILGLLAQGYTPKEAATLGIFLHATAGDLAAASLSEESMIATDITEHLGIAFKQLA